MGKGVFSKISEYAQKDAYYHCEDVARSYRDFGVPKSLAEEWICAKSNVSKELSERACDHVYYHSKD